MENIKEIKIIIRRHCFGISMGESYEVDRHGIKECKISLPSRRLDRMSNMIYSTKFKKDGHNGPLLCGLVENGIFYVIGFCHIPYENEKDGINWNTDSDDFYSVFNVIEIVDELSKLDLTTFEHVSNPEAVLAIKLTF